jgi:molybdopterin synthase sulfur carrier subunit
MRILYFAWLRERIGLAEEEVSPPPGIVTLADLTGWIKGRSPRHEAAFADTRMIRSAIDQESAGPETPLGNAREIAFFPPFTGG